MTRLYLATREDIPRIWDLLVPGLQIYREKSPHYVGTDEEIFRYLTSPDGDELAIVLYDGKYAGFITFKVQSLEGERWGTMAMIYLTRPAQEGGALVAATKQLEGILRARGCQIMNYMTARKGFKRVAPTLGFKPRIIEYMKEL